MKYLFLAPLVNKFLGKKKKVRIGVEQAEMTQTTEL